MKKRVDSPPVVLGPVYTEPMPPRSKSRQLTGRPGRGLEPGSSGYYGRISKKKSERKNRDG